MVANANGWDREEKRERTREGGAALFPNSDLSQWRLPGLKIARRDLMSQVCFFLLEPLWSP